VNFAKNHGGPIHYLGNRYLSLPNLSGQMTPDLTWLTDLFRIIENNSHGKRYKRAFEPFAGSASWSLAAMEAGLADEYHINDSDSILIHTHQLMKDHPEQVKSTYLALSEEYNSASSKYEFLVELINTYNAAVSSEKSLLLPFVVNHVWAGILFHDTKNNILINTTEKSEKKYTDFLIKPNLSPKEFTEEVDRVSTLFNTHKVIFTSGDFMESISELNQDDFVALNPPYPENTRSLTDKTGMYTELYSPTLLHEKLVVLIDRLDQANIDYFMTYGFYNPDMRQFVLRDQNQNPRNYFRPLGYEDCLCGNVLDQMYFKAKWTMPENLHSPIRLASEVLHGAELTQSEALTCFNQSK